MKMTVANLKVAAKNAGIKGVSKLRKAELEDAVMGQREGRKAVYEIADTEFAMQAVEQTVETGTFFLPRPEIVPEPVVSGTFSDFKALAEANREKDRVFKLNAKNKAGYVGKIKAIKTLILSSGLRNIRWHEDEKGFRLGLARRTAA